MPIQEVAPKNSKYLLALHSSSSTLGVGVINLGDPETSKLVKTFQGGRDLSNNLIKYIQELLPISNWKKIDRIAVSLGPGSYTGTRLTVMLARTICQQISCQMDGFSSFSLMAPRFAKLLKQKELYNSFWITQSLPRRGILAGEYVLKQNQSSIDSKEFFEISSPSLMSEGERICPAFIADEDTFKDTGYLLELSLKAHRLDKKSSWEKMLPIYPTSPVDKLK